MYSKVLVFGGTGFVGKNLKKHKPEWIFFDRKEWKKPDPLTNLKDVLEIYDFYKPDAVLHLAAKVGGIKDNAENQAVYYYENAAMNNNIIHGAHIAKINRVLSSLSTCAFPNVLAKYPFSEKDLFLGPPARTNFSYGYTKRALHVQTLSYRKQYNLNYSTFCPSNIYGPEDNFDSNRSHFAAALIKKFHNANDGDTLYFWGTGKPMRQQLYVGDLVKIIPLLLDKHNSDMPIIVAPHENLSIAEMVDTLFKNVNKNVIIEYNNRLDGQFRKDGSNVNLLKLIGDFKFTEFERGIVQTYEWFAHHHQNSGLLHA
tara:strand:+ start:3680 stop:4618 length:939 start_codon:yes stop_codon:yes gene_type:complete